MIVWKQATHDMYKNHLQHEVSPFSFFCRCGQEPWQSLPDSNAEGYFESLMSVGCSTHFLLLEWINRKWGKWREVMTAMQPHWLFSRRLSTLSSIKSWIWGQNRIMGGKVSSWQVLWRSLTREMRGVFCPLFKKYKKKQFTTKIN